jgi:hypothetical protein
MPTALRRASTKPSKPRFFDRLLGFLASSRSFRSSTSVSATGLGLTVFLDRLATILMLSAGERAMLFSLALPELDFSLSHPQ